MTARMYSTDEILKAVAHPATIAAKARALHPAAVTEGRKSR